MLKVSRLEVIATGARRRWTEEEKRRIVAESFDGPRRVWRQRGGTGCRRGSCLTIGEFDSGRFGIVRIDS